MSNSFLSIVIFAPPKANNFNPVADITMSASNSFPDFNLMPFSVNVSICSVTTEAFPSLIDLNKSPSGATQKR